MKDLLSDDLIIKKLTAESAGEISLLLKNESPEYSRYFIPFTFELETIRQILNNLKKDSFWGIFINNKLVGFYMLRGFDEGYEIPSYGVWISKEYSGKGLSKLTLQHAISFCAINHIKKMMLKVHPQNSIAKRMYEKFGFKQSGTDPQNKHLVYYKNIITS